MTGDGACAVWRACGRPCAGWEYLLAHRPVFSRFGRYGRQDSLPLDGNHMLRLISLPMPDGLRPGKRAIFLTPVPLPISIWMTWRSSSGRCEYAFPIGATSLRTGFLDNLQSNGCCTFN